MSCLLMASRKNGIHRLSSFLSFQKLQKELIVARSLVNLALARMGYFSVVHMMRSSANRALLTLIRDGRSLMKTRNKVQLNADGPSSSVLLEDVIPSTVVWIVLLVRKAWIYFSIFP